MSSDEEGVAALASMAGRKKTKNQRYEDVDSEEDAPAPKRGKPSPTKKKPMMGSQVKKKQEIIYKDDLEDSFSEEDEDSGSDWGVSYRPHDPPSPDFTHSSVNLLPPCMSLWPPLALVSSAATAPF